ncbi:MAG: AAA family ATPase [Candidatus Dadabacteria bacterium]|nr:AAA family ATPase [Candidatus Dadabacteria bacterium]
MPKNSLKGLNSSQIEAVTHGEGPLLVLAGPGSGKTRVIAHRIAYLINDLSIPPWNILAVTFTNKAAAEMKKRAGELVGDQISGAWIGTFHSICLRILKMEVDFLEGYTKDFVVYDQNDQLGLTKSCLKEFDYGETLFSPKRVLSEFDTVENKGEVLFEDDFYGRALRELYDFYKDELVKRNAMTFNDLLLQANKLLSENEEARVCYQDRFSHVLVDEYQDTNVSQYRFVKLLSPRHRNLFVVGDDSQSIYGWRGADITNILNFERDFPGARVVKLERNYRSTSTILGIANSVIKKNLGRKEKTLWTENPAGEKVVVFKAGDNSDEARFVAERVSHLVESGNFKWSDVAVFYRANFQSRVIEEGLSAQRIAYRIVSGVGFYQRAEIKDIIAYLRLIQNPRDNVSFERIANVPPRKIGGVTLRKLREISGIGGFALMDAIEYCQKQELLSGQALRALSRFLDMIREFGLVAQDQPAAKVINALLERIGYLDYLGKEHHRVENVKELLNAAEGLGEMTLSDFLDLVLLATDEDRGDSGGEKVSLMTIHAAKGLEFPVVFVVGVNEGLLPHQRSMDSLEGLEEERRLFYVAVTRAKQLLHISYASSRTTSGGVYGARRSLFLDDLPPEHVVYESRRKDFSGSKSDSYSDPPPEKPSREPEEADCSLRPGQKVTHTVFGPGVVKQIDGKGNETVVTVVFSVSGVKKILASYLTA